MKITDIRIRKAQNDGRMRAIISITLDNELVIHDIKVIEGNDRLFLAMPSRKLPDGTYRDIVHPILPAVRQEMETEILRRYEAFTAEQEQPAEPID